MHDEPLGLAKITLFFIQTSTALGTFRYSGFLDYIFGIVSLGNLKASAIECLSPAFRSDLVAYVFTMLLPFFFLALLMVAFCIGTVRFALLYLSYRFGSADSWSKEEQLNSRRMRLSRANTLQLLRRYEPLGVRYRGYMRRVVSRGTASFLFLLYASYFELSNHVMSMFNCRSEGSDSASYVEEMRWIRCYTPEHLQLVYAAVPFGLLYTVGIPLLFWQYLRQPHLSHVVHFMYERYRDKHNKHELLLFFRRILLVIAISFLSAQSELQSICIVSVLMIFAVAQQKRKPFLSKIENNLELASLVMLTLAYEISSRVRSGTEYITRRIY